MTSIYEVMIFGTKAEMAVVLCRFAKKTWLSLLLSFCAVWYILFLSQVCLAKRRNTMAIFSLFEHMHMKFEINGTKIKGGCQSGRKVVIHNFKTEWFASS